MRDMYIKQLYSYIRIIIISNNIMSNKNFVGEMRLVLCPSPRIAYP